MHGDRHRSRYPARRDAKRVRRRFGRGALMIPPVAVGCKRLLRGRRWHHRGPASHRRQPTLNQIGDIAWVLRSGPKRKDIGLVRSRDLRLRERLDFDED